MKPTLPTLLSFNGGYVDTVGYLSLQGLFTAHVTGNFVTIGAALVFGTSGIVAKLLALPVFCLVILVTRLASFNLPARWPVLETMLTLKLLLLLVAAILAIAMGPFGNADGAAAIIMGMMLVSAMAIQNAAHRIHLSLLAVRRPAPRGPQLLSDRADMARSAATNSSSVGARTPAKPRPREQLASSAGLAPRDVVKLGHCCDGSEAWSTAGSTY